MMDPKGIRSKERHCIYRRYSDVFADVKENYNRSPLQHEAVGNTWSEDVPLDGFVDLPTFTRDMTGPTDFLLSAIGLADKTKDEIAAMAPTKLMFLLFFYYFTLDLLFKIL